MTRSELDAQKALAAQQYPDHVIGTRFAGGRLGYLVIATDPTTGRVVEIGAGSGKRKGTNP